ncbi:hypothetical protein YC2023_050881 [Brassica napus]
MHGMIICKFNMRQTFFPKPKIFLNQGPNQIRQGPVHNLSLSISLGVTSGRE